MPKLLVDLLSYTGTRGGTETYAREIATRLPEFLPGWEFAAITNRAGAERVASFFPGEVRIVKWVGADRVSWALGEVLGADRAARRMGADLVWCPANFGPISRGVLRVMTVHDVIYHEVTGSLVARVIRGTTSWLMARAALTADAVITGSHAAASAVETHIGVRASDMTVVPHGTRDAAPPADPWSSLTALGIQPDRPIVLSTGNRLPHKNFEGLLRAVATIDAGNRPLTAVTGSHADDPLRPLVTTLGLEGDVVLPGWVTSEQLESLYAVADLYACPSLVEGFGLPVIDAMRRGCVVLANDVPVLREVGGTAALYADATDPAAFGAAIMSALTDAPDADRRAAGSAWSAGFTWERSAERTAEVFQKALAGHAGAHHA
jgi:glycosyltransferase involved in cell wall biosynthesis